MQTHYDHRDTRVEHLVRTGQKDKAIKLIARLAVEAAKNKQFDKAETYRDRLYEIGSIAQGAIVKVNDFISNEKKKLVPPDLRQLWPQFYDALSPEEASGFFGSLEEVSVDVDWPVITQGGANKRLYLVKSGGFKLVHENQDKEQLIDVLSSGRIFGVDTFFSINVCTVSVLCLFPGNLLYLEYAQLMQLKKNNPFIETNLYKVCHAENNISRLLRQKGIDRRTCRRINLQAKVKAQVLSPESQNDLQRIIKADLWDISQSGLSFYMQSKNRKAVKHLIGRTLGVRLQVDSGGQTKEASLTGVVHGVQNHPLDEYSVHIKLNRDLSPKDLETISRIAAGQ